jgi:hypothetical protein
MTDNEPTEDRVDNGTGTDTGTDASWPARHNTVLTIGAACVTPILYLVYVNHYAVNVFFFDNYPPIRLVASALGGRLRLSEVWAQYAEGRQPLLNLSFVLFGFLTRADVRSILFFSAAVFIASYAIVLLLFRKYLETRLTPVPVLLVGLVWFSLGDVQNSLFAYQLSLYLLVLSAFIMLFALTAPRSRRGLWLAVGVLAAIAASLSFINGFVAWPLGAICILWCQPWTRRTAREISIWLISMLGTAALYFHGYHGTETGCVSGRSCSLRDSLDNPLLTGRTFLALIGGVIPAGGVFPRWSNGSFHTTLVHGFTRFEVVGAALLAAAIFIIVQSWRHRSARERVPLPMLMICFALFWDAMITLGRASLGLAFVISINRYIMPNLILLTAIVIYAWAHKPQLRRLGTNDRPPYLAWSTLAVLLCFVAVQVSTTTSFALTSGRTVHKMYVEQARLWVNLDRVPVRVRACEVNLVLNFQLFTGNPPPQARRNKLGQFRPDSYRHYRKLGPPPLSPICIHTSPKPKPKKSQT